MTTTTDIRTQAKRAYVDLFRAALADAGETTVGVDYGRPGQPWREHVWLDQTTGDLEVPVMRPGALPYEDTFRTDVVIRVADPGATDAEEIERRSALLYGVLLGALRDPAQGGVRIGGGTIRGLRTVTLVRVVGPNSYQNPDGWVTAWRITLEASSRVTL